QLIFFFNASAAEALLVLPERGIGTLVEKGVGLTGVLMKNRFQSGPGVQKGAENQACSVLGVRCVLRKAGQPSDVLDQPTRHQARYRDSSGGVGFALLES